MAANRSIRVSVVMGVFNGGIELEPTVRSVLEQDFDGFEFIIIDDGSTDGSSEVLDRWAALDSRVKVEHTKNCGLTQALIRGCELATGEFIARQDCGDRSLPNRLLNLVLIFEKQPEVVLATSDYRHVAPDGEVMAIVQAPDRIFKWRDCLTSGDETLLFGPHHGAVMFRRSAYLAVGGYRQQFYFAQDMDLWTRIAAIGELYWINEVLYEAREHRGSISAEHATKQLALGKLICESVRLRSRGLSDHEVIANASLIRPDSKSHVRASRADHDYFIGSCLLEKGDPSSRRYLRRVLLSRPFHLKAWLKMLKAIFVSEKERA